MTVTYHRHAATFTDQHDYEARLNGVTVAYITVDRAGRAGGTGASWSARTPEGGRPIAGVHGTFRSLKAELEARLSAREVAT